MTTREEINQHIGWLKQYVGSMKAENWCDMRTAIENQVDRMSEDFDALAGTSAQGTPSEPVLWQRFDQTYNKWLTLISDREETRSKLVAAGQKLRPLYAYAPPAQGKPSSLPLCCVTGRIAGDKDACGDCDPCGASYSVPQAAKDIMAERDEWANKYSEVMGRLGEVLAERVSVEPGNELGALRQAIIDHTQGDMFWIGEILLVELEKETGFGGRRTADVSAKPSASVRKALERARGALLVAEIGLQGVICPSDPETHAGDIRECELSLGIVRQAKPVVETALAALAQPNSPAVKGEVATWQPIENAPEDIVVWGWQPPENGLHDCCGSVSLLEKYDGAWFTHHDGEETTDPIGWMPANKPLRPGRTQSRSQPESVDKWRETVGAKAREWAAHYKEASDGRNTFIMFAEWVEALELPQ
jgi:hypothetical protein